MAATDEEAVEQYVGPYVSSMSRIGRDRGWRRQTGEAVHEEHEHGSRGDGSTEKVDRKIAAGGKEGGARRARAKGRTGQRGKRRKRKRKERDDAHASYT